MSGDQLHALEPEANANGTSIDVVVQVGPRYPQNSLLSGERRAVSEARRVRIEIFMNEESKSERGGKRETHLELDSRNLSFVTAPVHAKREFVAF